MNDLERRIEKVEKRLVTSGEERPHLRSFAFGLLGKLEERFREQERELAEARARIRDLERANAALTDRIAALLAAIEGNMDEVDEIIRRLTKVARDFDEADDTPAVPAARSEPSGGIPALPPALPPDNLMPADEPIEVPTIETEPGRAGRHAYTGPILDINALFAKGTSRGPARR